MPRLRKFASPASVTKPLLEVTLSELEGDVEALVELKIGERLLKIETSLKWAGWIASALIGSALAILGAVITNIAVD